MELAQQYLQFSRQFHNLKPDMSNMKLYPSHPLTWDLTEGSRKILFPPTKHTGPALVESRAFIRCRASRRIGSAHSGTDRIPLGQLPLAWWLGERGFRIIHPAFDKGKTGRGFRRLCRGVSGTTSCPPPKLGKPPARPSSGRGRRGNGLGMVSKTSKDLVKLVKQGTGWPSEEATAWKCSGSCRFESLE